mmetsp:Transcript_114769/g.325093  ORF Transcript_114769/g.325093 Transcript_114769/m.325093 type:complete len:173 (-) Transcript_114769:136-654(-)
MGCGATAQKYQGSSLNSLDEERLPRRAGGSQSSAGDDEGGDEKPLRQASDAPGASAVQQADRYRPVEAMQAVDGSDAVEENMKMQLAIAAANDENLLRKYADGSERKRRSSSGKRVFAPDSGPLSGELLRSTTRQSSASSAPEDFQTLPNHTVGGFRMQHKHSSSPSRCMVR